MTLPGIKSIYTCPCAHLVPDMEYRYRAGIDIAVLTKLTSIRFWGTPLCECESAPQSNHPVETATLSFHTEQRIPRAQPLAFIIEDATGHHWCIGHLEPPYPQITQRQTTGSPSSDPAGYYVEVKLAALHALIPCMIANP